jgi:hypothetical protein
MLSMTIAETANILIDWRGPEIATELRKRASDFLATGNIKSQDEWLAILHEVEKLQRTQSKGARLN